MSLFSWSVELGAALVCLGAVLWLYRRTRKAEQAVTALGDQFELYAEASANVAGAVQRLVTEPADDTRPGTARRYLLHKARLAAADGRPPQLLAADYRLSNDEVRLLTLGAGTIGESPPSTSDHPGATRARG